MNKTPDPIPGQLIKADDGQRELAKAGASSSAMSEIQASITVAMNFPRDEQDAYGQMMLACQRVRFQERAIYKYPRGGSTIKGPSVNLAREFARLWRNIRYGFVVVSESEDTCHVRGYAWDQQTNTKVEQDASFKILVYRKNKGWIKPDERDKRELVNKQGSICERNCLLKVLPRDMVEDFMDAIEDNQRRNITNEMEANRKKVVGAFGTLNVSGSQLESYLGHPIDEATADEIVDLRGIYSSIRDGNTRWSEYVEKKQGQKAKPQTGEEQADLGSLVGNPEAATSGADAQPEDHKQPGHDRAPQEATPDVAPAATADPGQLFGPETVPVPKPTDKSADATEAYSARLSRVRAVSGVDKVIADAGADDSLTDSQFELVQSWCDRKRSELVDTEGDQ